MFNFLEEVKNGLKDNQITLETFNIINISGKLLYVEGHLGLIVLSKQLISFKVKKGVIMVEGEELNLAELNETTMKISGIIKKVEQI